jgi:hypothetical protein
MTSLKNGDPTMQRETKKLIVKQKSKEEPKK